MAQPFHFLWYQAFRVMWDVTDLLLRREPFAVNGAEGLAYRETRRILLESLGGLHIHPRAEAGLPPDLGEIDPETIPLLWSTTVFAALEHLLAFGPHDRGRVGKHVYCEDKGVMCGWLYIRRMMEDKASILEALPRAHDADYRAYLEGNLNCIDGQVAEALGTWHLLWYGPEANQKCDPACPRRLPEEPPEGTELPPGCKWSNLRPVCDPLSCRPFGEWLERRLDCDSCRTRPFWEDAAGAQAKPSSVADLSRPTKLALSAIMRQVREWRLAAGLPASVDLSGVGGREYYDAQDSASVPDDADQDDPQDTTSRAEDTQQETEPTADNAEQAGGPGESTAEAEREVTTMNEQNRATVAEWAAVLEARALLTMVRRMQDEPGLRADARAAFLFGELLKALAISEFPEAQRLAQRLPEALPTDARLAELCFTLIRPELEVFMGEYRQSVYEPWCSRMQCQCDHAWTEGLPETRMDALSLYVCQAKEYGLDNLVGRPDRRVSEIKQKMRRLDDKLREWRSRDTPDSDPQAREAERAAIMAEYGPLEAEYEAVFTDFEANMKPKIRSAVEAACDQCPRWPIWQQTSAFQQKGWNAPLWLPKHMAALHLQAVVELKPGVPDATAGVPPEPPTPQTTATDDFAHSDDYRTVTYQQQRFVLTPQQATVVCILHEARCNGEPDLSSAAILTRMAETTGYSPDRLHLSGIFRNNRPAQRLVISQRRGMYRLNL